MSKGTEWPRCTAHPHDCGHAASHESEAAADAYARSHLNEFVNRNGYAICTCHPLIESDALRVTPFPCGS